MQNKFFQIIFPKAIFIVGGIILINNSTNQNEKNNFNSELIMTVMFINI